MISQGFYSSPLGSISVTANAMGVTSVHFVEENRENHLSSEEPNEHTERCMIELDRYFKGEQRYFHTPYMVQGTAFQQRVWEYVHHVAYGKTTSYIDIARAIGYPNHARAVGNALSKNHVAIMLPCHRVLKKDGQLNAYAWGPSRKQWLLDHEQRTMDALVKGI